MKILLPSNLLKIQSYLLGPKIGALAGKITNSIILREKVKNGPKEKKSKFLLVSEYGDSESAIIPN